jgi:hypothetical protein
MCTNTDDVAPEYQPQDQGTRIRVDLWSGEIYRIIGLLDKEIAHYERQREKYKEKFGTYFVPAPGKTDVNVTIPARIRNLRNYLAQSLGGIPSVRNLNV